MINRIERPLANDHPDGSFSVHLFLHRPKTQISRIIGQYTHNLLGLKTLSFALLLSSTKIWIKGPQIGSDMPSALGLVSIFSMNVYWELTLRTFWEEQLADQFRYFNFSSYLVIFRACMSVSVYTHISFWGRSYLYLYLDYVDVYFIYRFF